MAKLEGLFQLIVPEGIAEASNNKAGLSNIDQW